jgi:2-hydroxy-3-keto-5-methylthiopentenyl-1-phosphate phosphatase
MKDFIFVSDFDGTLTGSDFYQILIDKHLGKNGIEPYKRWRNGSISVSEFLNIIFTSIDLTEKEIFDDIKEIEFDDSSLDLVRKIKKKNGDFVILSAGSSYYIKKLLEFKQIEGIDIIANKAIYKNGGIHMQFDLNSQFYSEISGIDKAKIVSSFKNKYKKIYYAGDGEPDYNAAIQADLIFAKTDLKEMLQAEKIKFINFITFLDIDNYLTVNGVI